MSNRIKVFTCNEEPSTCGDTLTSMCDKWIESHTRGIEIVSVHSNSNKYGWMLVVTFHYK